MSTTEYVGFTISNTMPSRCHFFSDWFFCKSVQAPVQRFLLSTKGGGGGNLGNETASTSSIVPVDIHYASREKRTLFQTPEITLISSAERLAASAVKIKTKRKRKNKNKKKTREENAVITLISMEDAKPMTSNRRHYTPSRLAKLSGLVLLVTPFFIAFWMTVDLWNPAKYPVHLHERNTTLKCEYTKTFPLTKTLHARVCIYQRSMNVQFRKLDHNRSTGIQLDPMRGYYLKKNFTLHR